MVSSTDVYISDCDLVERVRQGDQEAFRLILERYKRVVFAVVYSISQNSHDAEDIAQEAFVDAYFNIGKLEQATRVGSWLVGIARNKALNYVSRQPRYNVPFDTTVINEELTNTTDMAIQQELRQRIRQAIAALPIAEREAVILFYITGYKQRELAQLLDTPLGTIKRRLFTARQKLREELWQLADEELSQKRPTDSFDAKVQLALANTRKARSAKELGEAMKHCDSALHLICQISDPRTAKQLRAQALQLKGELVFYANGKKASLEYIEESAQLYDELGDTRALAQQLQILGVYYSNAGHVEKAQSVYERALALFHEIDDSSGEGNTLFWLASRDMHHHPELALQRVSAALPLLDRPTDRSMYVVCTAAVRLLKSAQRAAKVIDELNVFGAACEIIKDVGTGLRYAGQPGYGGTGDGPMPDPRLDAELLYEIQQLGAVYDKSWLPGYTWKGTAFSYTLKPLRLSAQVIADNASIQTAAGLFHHCRQVEWETQPSSDDEGEERRKKLNKINCGRKVLWYAPGVGPVRLEIRRANGVDIDIELENYVVTEASDSYFPMAIGNRWAYKVTNVSTDYCQERVYEVTHSENDRFYLAHHEVVYWNGSNEA